MEGFPPLEPMGLGLHELVGATVVAWHEALQLGRHPRRVVQTADV
jgi:hypothetical protein